MKAPRSVLRINGALIVAFFEAENNSVHLAYDRLKLSEQFEKGIHHPGVDQHQPIVIVTGFPKLVINSPLQTSQFRMPLQKSVSSEQGFRVLFVPNCDQMSHHAPT